MRINSIKQGGLRSIKRDLLLRATSKKGPIKRIYIRRYWQVKILKHGWLLQ